MNLAILFAGLGGADGPIYPSSEEFVSQVRADEPQPMWQALSEFSLAMERGDADELAVLLRPLQVDEWRESGAPAILRVAAGREDLWSGPTLELDAFEGRALCSGRHFEAWYRAEGVTITPQDGNSHDLRIELVVPYESDGAVALVPVSSPVRPGEWNATAEDLRAQARRLQESQESTPSFKCKPGMVLGPDQRWRVGCAPGACETRCTIRVVPGEQGVDSFQCDCHRVNAIEPLDAPGSEDSRELSA